MCRFRKSLSMVTLAGALVACAFAEKGQRMHVVVNDTGVYTITEEGAVPAATSQRDAGEVLWTYSHATSVPQSAALCAEGGTAWVAQWNVSERLQRFAITGEGVPDLEVPAGADSDPCVAAAEEADLAAFLDTEPTLVLKAFKSTSPDPIWTYPYPDNYDVSSTTYRGVSVSRDGNVVACYAKDSVAGVSEVRFFDGATGATINFWKFQGTLTALDLTDDGSLCLVTQSSVGIVLDVASATEIFQAPGSGGGNTFHRISGDGSVIALGGFRLEVYTWDGTTYNRVLNYNPSQSWFGRGIAISSDGNTVGASSYKYSTYLDTFTRIWDIPSLTMLGEYSVSGGGGYQDVMIAAEMSSDGSVFAVGFWGTEDNAHPELMVFDRNVNVIGGVDTPGSVYALDLTRNGVYALAGAKAVHANVFGAGCTVNTYQVLEAGCDADIDGDGDTDISDLAALLGAYHTAPGDPNWNANADFNGNGYIEISDLAFLLGDYGCE